MARFNLLGDRQLRRGVMLAILASGASPAALLAQESSPQAEAASATAQDIVVTARRRDERLQDVPAAISVVGADQINKYSVNTAMDIGKMVPQVLISKTASGTNSSITIRGVGSPSFSVGFDQSVSINVDGIQISRGNAIQIGYLDLGQLSVIKGPQALYYGKNSTAGIISLETQNPGLTPSLAGTAGYEFAKRQYYAEVAGSTPLSDKVRVRLAVRYSDQDGYFYNKALPHRDPSIPTIPEPGAASSRGEAGKELSGRLTLMLDPTEGFSAKIKAFVNRSRGAPVPRQLWRCGGPGGTVPQAVLGYVNVAEDCKINRTFTQHGVPEAFLPNWVDSNKSAPFQNVDAQLFIADLKGEIGQFNLNSLTGYYHYDTVIQTDAAGGTVVTTERQNYTAFSQELRLASDFDGPVNFVIGSYYQDTKLPHRNVARNAALPVDPATGKYQTFEKSTNTKTKTLSGFAEAIWEIVPKLELDAGVRWTHEKKTYSNIQPYVAPARRAAISMNELQTGGFKDSNWSPQATLTYRPTSDITVYGAYKTGFKTGGYNATATLAPGQGVSAQQFGSEKARGWETGLKVLLDDGRLSINTAIYDFTYKDLQVLVFDAASSSYLTRNAGKLITKGIEVDGVWNLNPYAPGLTLRSSVTYNRARYQDYVGPCYAGQHPDEGCNLVPLASGAFNGQLYSGRTPPRAPLWAGNIGGDFRQPLTDGLDIQFTIDARYTAKFNTSDALRPDAEQKGYTLLDGSVRLISDENWELAVIGRNLTNKLVVYVGGDQPLTGSNTGRPTGIRSDLNAVVGNGREIAVEAKFRF